MSVFSLGGGVSACEGLISLAGHAVLSAPGWNCLVLGIAIAMAGIAPSRAHHCVASSPPIRPSSGSASC